MAKLTPLSLSVARSLGSPLGLDIAFITPLDEGSVNSNFKVGCTDGAIYFARIFEEQSERGALAERRLLTELDAAGIPTAVPVSAGDAGLCFHNDKPLSFYPWASGVHLCNEQVTPERAHTLGRALASVHLASKSLSDIPAGRFGLPGIRKRLELVRAETDRFNEGIAFIEERLRHYEALRDPGLPSGLVHGDLFRDNVLWEGEQISALLDFESACGGAFVYDLSVCAAAWCYTDRFRPDQLRALFSGYQALRPLTVAERGGLRVEAALACLRFASTRLTDFSLRCPPGTEPKRSYVRFLDRVRAIEAGALDLCLEVKDE